jgi:hypothetical protein
MTTQDMTPERLDAILAAYGAAPVRWPEDEREAAEALIARSDHARAVLAQAAHLDRLLDAAPPVPAADALAARLRALAPAATAAGSVVPLRPRARPAPPWHASTFARAAVVALALVGGVGIGIAVPDGELAGPDVPTQTASEAADVDVPASDDLSLAAIDSATDTGDNAADEAITGTPMLASLMQTGAPGFTTVTYVQDSSDEEALALAALPLQ